jgi:hypothetical protein
MTRPGSESLASIGCPTSDAVVNGSLHIRVNLRRVAAGGPFCEMWTIR